MSKSLGNCYTIPQLTARGHEPSAIRYLLLSGHYRAQLNFTFDGLEAAARAVTRLHEFRRRLRVAVEAGSDASSDGGEAAASGRAAFEAAMDDDLNVSEALSAVFGLVREANSLLDETFPRAPAGAGAVLGVIDDFDRVFGVLALRDRECADADAAEEEDLVAWATARVEDREDARASRDYARADAIRAELEARGVTVEDLADRTRLRLGPRTVVVARPRS